MLVWGGHSCPPQLTWIQSVGIAPQLHPPIAAGGGQEVRPTPDEVSADGWQAHPGADLLFSLENRNLVLRLRPRASSLIAPNIPRLGLREFHQSHFLVVTLDVGIGPIEKGRDPAGTHRREPRCRVVDVHEISRPISLDLSDHLLLHLCPVRLVLHEAVDIDVTAGGQTVGVEIYLWFGSEHNNSVRRRRMLPQVGRDRKRLWKWGIKTVGFPADL